MLFHDAVLAMASNRWVRHLMTTAPALRALPRRFVAGDSLDDAIKAIRALNALGLHTTLDLLGESVTDEAEARQATAEYIAALDRVKGEGLSSHISVKVSQLGLDLGMELCLANMRALLDRARALGTFVRLDMESSAYTQRTLDVHRTLRADYDNVGVVIQAYLRRSEADVEALAAFGGKVRLCKGAYSEPASLAFPRKADVDANYLKLLGIMWRPASLAGDARVAVATHDEKIIKWALSEASRRGIPPDQFEFQMLYGIRRDLQVRLAAQGHSVRIYVPFGTQWYPYFSRRLAERPANLFFTLRNLTRG
jgi:proline dehydrogenase